MRITCISDTHSKHFGIDIPQCDVLIHAGDVTSIGTKSQFYSFIEWFDMQPATYKIWIGGNHDLSLDPQRSGEGKVPDWLTQLIKDAQDQNIFYLENSGCKIGDIKFWGSPITPDFFPQHWAFNKPRGEEINKVWKEIPNDIDVLITHGPPHDIGDKVGIENTGCKDLLQRVKIIKPKYHIFGHIHEGYGQDKVGETTFINASICDVKYRPINDPIEIEI